MFGYIYLTTNIINNKIYIGQHINEEWHYDVKYIGSGLLLNRAINKYGKENFNNQLICYADNQESLNNLEIFFIDYYDSTNPEIGYNISKGGNSSNGVTNWIKENEPERFKLIQEKISIKLTGKCKTKIACKNMSIAHLGNLLSEEHKKNISINNGRGMLGKHHSKKSNQQNSNSLKKRFENIENHPMYSKHHSNESKEKSRLSHLGQFNSEYTKKLKGLNSLLRHAIKRNDDLEIIENIKNKIKTLKELNIINDIN